MTQPSNSELLVPQSPVLSPTELTLRSGQKISGGAGYFRFFWARNGIYYGLRALGIRPGDKILVPSYLCSAAIEPIEHAGGVVEFYAIRRSCEPDWSDLEARIRDGVKAILAVHYFGFPCDMEKFCALRDRYNLFLIEDCAHVLDGVPNGYRFGESGDFSVFSPRKHYPVFDGGTLRLNRATPGFRVPFQFESPLFTLRVAKNLLESRKSPARPTAAPTPHEPPTKSSQHEEEMALLRDRPQKPLYVYPNYTSFLPWMAGFPMSRLSRYLIRHLPIAGIAAKRRANYCSLLEKVSRIAGVQPLYRELPAGVVPWILPLTLGKASDGLMALRALGIPAVTWGDVRDSRISARDFPDADFLYDQLIFLPIHQGLEAAHIERISDAVARVCEERT